MYSCSKVQLNKCSVVVRVSFIFWSVTEILVFAYGVMKSIQYVFRAATSENAYRKRSGPTICKIKHILACFLEMKLTSNDAIGIGAPNHSLMFRLAWPCTEKTATCVCREWRSRCVHFTWARSLGVTAYAWCQRPFRFAFSVGIPYFNNFFYVRRTPFFSWMFFLCVCRNLRPKSENLFHWRGSIMPWFTSVELSAERDPITK